MVDAEFTAYLEGLPAQDRRTVEQALHGLRHALNHMPRLQSQFEGPGLFAPTDGRARIQGMLNTLRQIARRDRPRFWARFGRG